MELEDLVNNYLYAYEKLVENGVSEDNAAKAAEALVEINVQYSEYEGLTEDVVGEVRTKHRDKNGKEWTLVSPEKDGA